MCGDASSSDGSGNGSDSKYGSKPSAKAKTTDVTATTTSGQDTAWGQDLNGDNKVSWSEKLTDMTDGGGKGASKTGSVSQAVSRDPNSKFAPATSGRPISRPTTAQFSANANRQSAIDAAVIKAGYTKLGSPSTGGQGYVNYTQIDPVTKEKYYAQTTAYKDVQSKAERDFLGTPEGLDYTFQDNTRKFTVANEQKPLVDQTLFDNASGKNNSLTAEQVAQAQRDLGRAMMTSQVTGATFDNPLGNAMSSTVAGNANFLGTNTTADSYAANVRAGYNRTSGMAGLGGRDLDTWLNRLN